MTDAETSQSDESRTAPDPDGYGPDDLAPKDGMLNLLLSMFHGDQDESHEGSFSITLQCGGAVISGVAISRSAWQKTLLDSLEDAGTNHIPVLREALADKEKALAAKWDARENAGFIGGRRNFIHMRDVRILGGADVNLPLWRGKLEDVTGWSLGAVGAPD